MHAPRPLLAGAVLLTLLVLGIACGKKNTAPTAPKPDPPACSVSPETLSFGSVRVGSAADLGFSITNSGGGTLAGSISDTSAVFTVGSETSYSLTAGQSAYFGVRFAPLREGAQSATILTGSSGCPTVTCTGTTPTDPICSLWPRPLAFGEVEVYSSKELAFTITNSGGGTLSGTVTSPRADFQVVGNAAYSLAANQSATFTVRFTPSRGDTQTCFLNTGSTCGPVPLTGTGIYPPGQAIAQLDFGQVAIGQSAERTFTVSYSITCGTNPYAVCASTPGDARFWVYGSSASSALIYRCDLDYDITFPHTYTVLFVPLQAGPQHCLITLQCKSVPLQNAFTRFGYVVCTGVGY